MTGSAPVRPGRGQRVVVAGGGLSGISAAIALRDAGAEVTLIEARSRLGGAASTFRRRDLEIDNGQHVFLRCCTEYRTLLDRIGATAQVRLQDRFDVTVLSPDSSPGRLRRGRLPAPLHFAGALARYSLLAPADRIRVIRAAAAMAVARPGDPRLDLIRLGDWLAARGQSEPVRRRLWDLFVVSALNIAGDEASTALAAKVIKTALLERNDAADIGVPAVPLGRLHHDAASGLLAQLGVNVLLRTRVTAVDPQPGGGFAVAITHRDGGGPGLDELPAAGVVLAVPVPAAAELTAALFPRPPAWTGLAASPIVNVHVIYDRTVTDLPFAAAVGSPVQWVFDRTQQAGLRTGQYLAVSLSAADEYAAMPVAALSEMFRPALERLLPAAARAQISDFFVTRERRATFRAVPGSAALRPGPATQADGLVLAGSWTDTGWPDTMEGAVRSGKAAAGELLRQLGRRGTEYHQIQVAA